MTLHQKAEPSLRVRCILEHPQPVGLFQIAGAVEAELRNRAYALMEARVELSLEPMTQFLKECQLYSLYKTRSSGLVVLKLPQAYLVAKKNIWIDPVQLHERYREKRVLYKIDHNPVWEQKFNSTSFPEKDWDCLFLSLAENGVYAFTPNGSDEHRDEDIKHNYSNGLYS